MSSPISEPISEPVSAPISEPVSAPISAPVSAPVSAPNLDFDIPNQPYAPIKNTQLINYADLYHTPSEIVSLGDSSAEQEYLNALMYGTSNVYKDKGQLPGNRYFIDANSTCKDNLGNSHPRSVLVDNVLKSSMTKNGDKQGLLYSLFASLTHLNSLGIMTDVSNAYNDICVPVSVYLNDKNIDADSQMAWVSRNDYKQIDPAAINQSADIYKFVQTSNNVQQGFTTLQEEDEQVRAVPEIVNKRKTKTTQKPADPVNQFYIACLTVLGIYILYRLHNR